MVAIRTTLLGEQTAENDGKLLLSSFIETPEYRLIIETKDSTVVVGRRGTGKSALFAKLGDFWSQQKGSHVLQIAPEDWQTIIFRGLFRSLNGQYSVTRSAAKMLWKYGILLETIVHLAKHFKTRDHVPNTGTVATHLKRWISIGNKDFFSRLVFISSPHLKAKQEVEELLGLLHADLNLNEIEQCLAELLELTNLRFFILIDKLDEGYENDEMGAAIVSGAIATVAELNKKYLQIRAVIFQRDNILRAVQKFDPDYTRNIEGEVLPLHWDTFQLLNLVSKRLNVAFNLELEKAQRIWDKCTADEGFGRELRGIAGFRKCLQFTLFRPRDLLLLLNQAFYNAAREDRETIILRDLEKTARTISSNRLEDLKKEYSSIFPVLQFAVSVFETGSPELHYNTALALLDNVHSIMPKQVINLAAEQDFALLRSDGVLRALYSVGFLGTHDSNSNSFTFCHDGRQPDREFSAEDRILIHPCYWIALNLTRDALAPEEAEQINDEYEIKVTSLSPQIRASRIGAIIASIGKIDQGREHADDFEEWALHAVQTVFAGHLANLELKPNGNSVQRRDIVGTNLARTSAWSRIEKDYNVRQVVFDAKNYAGVGRDEYRQMATYLNGRYGSLGFLITRDEDENIRAGAELDWVREIYYQEKKLVLRLSYKFLTRLLGKLRNPEKHDAIDHALNVLLDNYERQYLSLPTTRGQNKNPSNRV